MIFRNLRKKIKDKWFYFPIVSLALFFIIRLIYTSRVIWKYPFDTHMDLAAYMNLLFISAKYGFHQFVSIWCNGFILFQTYYPAWFYFTLPIYYLTKNIGLTTFISFLVIYMIGFILIYWLGKLHKISKIKRIAFFLFLFVNPITLGYILRIGRITELFSWVVFILFFILIIKYKDKSLDKYFLLFIPIYSLLLLSHYTAFILSTSLIASLVLVRRKVKEIIYILLGLLLFLIITAFWWIPFIKNIGTTYGEECVLLKWIVSSIPGTFMDKLTTIIIPIMFLIIFYLYWKSKSKDKEELLFFLPQILLAILLLFRILPFIPLFNRTTPDSYNILFIFLSLFLFFKTKFTKKYRKLIIPLLFILPIIGILITSILSTPFSYVYSDEDKDIIDLLKDVDGKLYVYPPEQRQSYTYYGYGAIYYNISSPMSGAPALLPLDLLNKRRLITKYLYNKDCINLFNTLKNLKAENLIVTKENCNLLIKCKFNLKRQNKNACLFDLRKEN